MIGRRTRSREPKAGQLALELKARFRWGGKREGAGRKKTGRAGVAHRRRERFGSRDPLHVTLRLGRAYRNLRTRGAAAVLRAAFQGGKERFGFRLTQFSVQPAHLHLMAEAQGPRSLARGVKGLCVRIARRLNRLLRRKGQVFSDRYHARVLRTPSEVRRALLYVLQNARHHPETGAPAPGVAWCDDYSSARLFDGWKAPPPATGSPPPGDEPVVAARAWLLCVGWRRRGLIDPCEGPA